jgi:hypothetical protein
LHQDPDGPDASPRQVPEPLESIVNPEIDGLPNSTRKQDRGQEGNTKRISFSRRTRDPVLIDLNKAIKQSSARTREDILEREKTFWMLWATETTHSRR